MTDPSIRKLAARLLRLENQAHSRATQLEHSSLEDGALREFDLEGVQVAQYGKQFDGTSTAATLVSPAPPAPSDPIASGAPGGISVLWDGTFENDITVIAPMDWKHTDVVVGPIGMDPIATPPTVTITSPRGGVVYLPFEPGTYEVALVTRTLSGRASAPSTIVAVDAAVLVGAEQFDQALEDELIAQRVAGRLGEFLTVRANNLEAIMVLATMITSGGVGRRWEADQQGIRVLDASGAIIINFPTDPDTPASFLGDLVATSLTVNDQLAIRGLINEISRGAKVTLAAGTTAPTSPPAISIDWETLDTHIANGDPTYDGFNPGRYGWVRWDGAWWSAHNGAWSLAALQRYQDDGDVDLDPGSKINIGMHQPTGGLTVLGGNIYVLGKESISWDVSQWVVEGYDPSGDRIARWLWSKPANTSDAVIWSNGVNVMLSYVRTDLNVLVWRAFNAATGVAADIERATTLPTAAGAVPAAAHYSSTDLAAFRLFVVFRNGTTVYSIDGNAAYIANNNFPAPSSGIMGLDFYDGVLWSHDPGGTTLYKHTTIKWTAADSALWHTSVTWRDDDPGGLGLHETAQGPRKSFTMKKRARLTITPPPLPLRPLPNTEDDAASVGVYIGRGAADPGRTYMEHQGTLNEGEMTLALTSVSLPGSGVLATNPPPASSNFPEASPARIVSADEVSTVLAGDGTATLGGAAGLNFDPDGVTSDRMAPLSHYPGGSLTLAVAGAQAWAGGPGVVFIAPASGAVKITTECFIKASAAGVTTHLAPEVRAGGVLRAGAVVIAANFAAGAANYNAEYLKSSGHRVFEGLTPGDTYNVALVITAGGIGADFTAAGLMVEAAF